MEEHYYLIWPALFCVFIKTKRPWLPTAIFILIVTIWRMIEYRYQILAPHLATTEFRARTDLFIDYIAWGSLAAFANASKEFKDAFFKYSKEWMIAFAIIFMHLLLFIKTPLPDTLKAISIQVCLLLTINYPNGRFSRFLEYKFISKIGLYSYSLYVWQQLFFTPRDQQIAEFSLLQTPPVNIILLIVFVFISYNYLEIPSINFGKKYLKKINLSR
jgi:peptidoglycan/LPS O-acetylase OafA/YrhL